MRKVAIFVLVALIAGCCGREAGDHGSMTVVELEVVGGGTVKLACPVYDSKPKGAHGRECYIVSE